MTKQAETERTYRWRAHFPPRLIHIPKRSCISLKASGKHFLRRSLRSCLPYTAILVSTTRKIYLSRAALPIGRSFPPFFVVLLFWSMPLRSHSRYCGGSSQACSSIWAAEGGIEIESTGLFCFGFFPERCECPCGEQALYPGRLW